MASRRANERVAPPMTADTVPRPDGPLAARYPRELEGDMELRDGTRLHVRPIRAGDAPRLIELYSRLSAHSAYQRFFTTMKRLPPDWARLLADVDYRSRLALIAEHGPPGAAELVAVARYEPTDRADTAEVAFTVLDAWQGRGIGTALLQRLLDAAAERGIRRFRAYVLADNGRMLDMLRRFTDVQQSNLDAGVVEVAFTRPSRIE